MSPRTDAEIVRAVLEGDRNSYSLLVDAYSERIINYLARMTGNRYEAEELAQDAFVRAYYALHSYKPQYKFSTWLFKIATNLCINHLKKRNRLVHVDDYQDQEGQSIWAIPDPDTHHSPAIMAERRELQRDIQEAINQLPSAFRIVVILRHLHDLSYQEIADVTDLPIGTVKSRLGRGRSRLALLLQGRVGGDT
jgi:RNA polymerase sigma-70 factor (ECF subfamily)